MNIRSSTPPEYEEQGSYSARTRDDAGRRIPYSNSDIVKKLPTGSLVSFI